MLDKPEQLNALAKMDELQREAPDLAGRRMRYPGSASRAAIERAQSRPARYDHGRIACGRHEPKAGHRLTFAACQLSSWPSCPTSASRDRS